MKVDNLLPFAIVAVTLVASAEPREVIRPINETEMAWNWLMSIGQGEMDESHLISHGMTTDQLPKIKEFAKDAQAQDVAWWQAENAKLCKHRAKYENDAESLAEWYERMQVDQLKNQQKILDGLEKAIGPADAISFQTAVIHATEPVLNPETGQFESPGISGHMDNAGMLRDGTVTPTQLLDVKCETVPETVTELRAE